MKIARCCVKPKSVEIYFVRETQPSHMRFELILFGGKKKKNNKFVYFAPLFCRLYFFL